MYNTYIFGSSCSRCYSRGESGKDNIYVEQALEQLRRQVSRQLQYSYFCTSKASKLSTEQLRRQSTADLPGARLHLYFCTSKASKLSIEQLRRQSTADPPGARLLALQLALMTLVQKYLLYWNKSTNTDAEGAGRCSSPSSLSWQHLARHSLRRPSRMQSVLTLLALLEQKHKYCNRTNTAAAGATLASASITKARGTYFTCFTGTKEQILTLQAPTQATRFTPCLPKTSTPIR